MSLNVAIVGPGRSKQGTGPFIARTFQHLDCDVKGVVSSTLASALAAKEMLSNEHAITCEAFEHLETLLDQHEIDVVAICSPAESHLQYLEIAIDSGCHVFCEKPLWWPSRIVQSQSDIDFITAKTTKLVQKCYQKEILLQLNTQWPFTLTRYFELYPECKEENSIHSFSMWLAPQSNGSEMIVDTTSHALSMLYTLVGGGKINNIESNFHESKNIDNLIIEYDYLHAQGDTHVTLSLHSSNASPKPAAYAINGRRVDRHVELPNYLISLCTSNQQLPITDPLECSIKNFISSIYSKTTSDEVALIDGTRHMAEIYLAITQP